MHSIFTLILGGIIAAQPALDARIATSKTQHPETFARVFSVVAQADKLDHAKRGTFAAMSPLFRAAGPNAGPALIEPLLHPERFKMPTEPSARIALRAGLIEAAGALSDPSMAPLWRSLLETSDEPHEVRAAVEALGRVAADTDAARVIALAKAAGPKQHAVLGGLGTWRRSDVARALGDAGAGTDSEASMISARTLARLGSSWLPDATQPAMVVVRNEAARQAIRLFVHTKGTTAASDAVMAIDAPETPNLITAARTPDSNKVLDALASRFSQNPVRR